VTLLQVGDVHYPRTRELIMQDLADTGFPTPVSRMAAPKPLQNVMKKAMSLIDTVDALLLCGDLTEQGDLEGYSTCVQYLRKAMALDKRPVQSIHVVPGNHDVNLETRRNAADTMGKFEPLTKVWADTVADLLAAKAHRASEVTSEGCRVALYSLNSCVGCQEPDYLPPAIRKELSAIIDRHVADKGDADGFRLAGEVLDTPAFVEEHLTAVGQAIESLDKQVLPVVVAHHNLLPQRLNRLHLYAELVNAGMARTRLARMQRKILYCHGHIHEHLVESVADPGSASAAVTCVAAPELHEGFNLIRIEYGLSRFPLGCIVFPYRLERDGSVVAQSSNIVRIPLRPAFSKEMKVLCRQLSAELLSCLDGDFVAFPRVINCLKSKTKPSVRRNVVAETLLEAEWLGVVEILDRDEDCNVWRVRKVAVCP